MYVRARTLQGNTPADHLNVDFSFAGYANCERPLPSLNGLPTIVLNPTYNAQCDRTADIQHAIDSLPGSGGIVYFAPGFYCLGSDTIKIAKSNVNLCGDSQGVTFGVQGRGRYLIEIGKADISRPEIKGRTAILDPYIGVGAVQLRVEKPQAFSVGQEIVVERLATAEWIAANGMDKLVRDGKQQTWMKEGQRMSEVRKIKAIQGDTLHLTLGLTDSINSDYKQQGMVASYSPPKDAIHEVGISNIRFLCQPSQCGHPISLKDVYTPFRILSHTYDSFLNNLSFEGFLSSIQVDRLARRLTFQDCIVSRDARSNRSSGYTGDISINGSEILILRCQVLGERGSESLGVVAQSAASGPNAVVGFKSAYSGLQAHARWSTSMLCDGCDVAFIEFANRGIMGSGHGWSTTSSIAWNSKCTKLVCSKPPTGMNYAVGCISNDVRKTDGTVISMGTHVKPLGLFAHQLMHRVGAGMAGQILNMLLEKGEEDGPFVAREDQRPSLIV